MDFLRHSDWGGRARLVIGGEATLLVLVLSTIVYLAQKVPQALSRLVFKPVDSQGRSSRGGAGTQTITVAESNNIARAIATTVRGGSILWVLRLREAIKGMILVRGRIQLQSRVSLLVRLVKPFAEFIGHNTLR
jgi:hypothetical protein